jgi:Na+/melibiose symporter-like transporter
MAIFAYMLQSLRTFLNRPVAEDFRFKNQIWQSLQSGLYVFLFIYLFSGSSFAGKNTPENYRVLMLAVFGAGCAVATLLANWVVPLLLPTVYDEDRWTVWKHVLQTLFVLLCISLVNQLLLILTDNAYPPFWQMYISVTVIGFFPIIISVFIVEQRRLKRTLAHAQALNEQLAHRSELAMVIPTPKPYDPADAPTTVTPSVILLTSENGKERLSLEPDQLLYIESVGNYVEVHWLNKAQSQTTVLRSTLKEIADNLASYSQFFRCHRAFLVNLKAVNHTEGNARGYQLTLKESTVKIPVSRSYLDAFDERMTVLL